MIPASVLAGVGVCSMIVGATVAAVAGVERADQGLASGVFNTTQQLGVALRLAVAVLAAGSRPEVAGHRRSLLVCAGFALAALVTALALARASRPAAGVIPAPR